eukprot:TRINITY_DN5960_c0_g1_i1.p1 TRINITY_DN5960_c0_g1~~TRINITY_DN5960_c0_g1_i1.p1  ORF type:complete len:921 (-),score=177.43 TRINITY_DN5960_c0_g1_i1:454-3216(-)
MNTGGDTETQLAAKSDAADMQPELEATAGQPPEEAPEQVEVTPASQMISQPLAEEVEAQASPKRKSKKKVRTKSQNAKINLVVEEEPFVYGSFASELSTSNPQQPNSDDDADDDNGLPDIFTKFKPSGKSIQETDLDANRTLLDSILYKASNAIAADKNVTFKFLGFLTIVSSALQALIWFGLSKWSHEQDPAATAQLRDFSYWESLFETFQLIMAQGRDQLPVSIYQASGVMMRMFYLVQLLSGLVLFAVFVGFITDSVTGFMNELAEGRTKVVAKNHTLILGWNEATIRVVCQIAFLRRQYQIMNDVWYRRWFPWKRLPPSTPLSASEIVILSSRFEKKEMDEMLEAAMIERGISPKRTKIGSDVICRVGDPTNPHDLVRVAAAQATSILVMMTQRDAEEADVSEGLMENGATIRTLLALRRVLFADQKILEGSTFSEDFRIVVQLARPVDHMNSAYFNAPCGRRVIYPVDLSQFLNSLMFSCATQPGLARVLMDLLNFEKPSIRKRRARDLIGGPQMRPGGLVGLKFEDAAAQIDDCILIGIIDPARPGKRGDGIAPANSERVLQPDDLVIFVGLRSMPTYDRQGSELAIEYKAEAMTVKKRESQQILPKKNIMVCGWRQIWSLQRKRFAKRVEDLTTVIASGSTVVFVNQVPQEEFIEILQEGGFRCLDDPDDPTKFDIGTTPGSKIMGRHVYGDPNKIEVLRPVIAEIDFDSTIVLGSQAGVVLPDSAQDMRVLNMMLLLRYLMEEKDSTNPMHVVGENNLDDTADLALPPIARDDDQAAVKQRVRVRRTASQKKQAQDKNRQADFINTQAIIARTLVQTLANPIINPAVKELFDNTDGLPFVYLPAAEVVVKIGEEMPFGVVQHAVREHFRIHTHAICIGYAKSAEDPLIAPSKRHMVRLERGDSLICIMRSNP